ncbi:MAG: hypothetical protein HC907_32930 [Richelia sp. SM1_7_0]|nr:hypothetical protein [Richelia sp. SM1_7_0]
MNIRLISRAFSLVGLTTAVLTCGGLSAQAENIENAVSIRSNNNNSETVINNSNVTNTAADLLVQTPVQTPVQPQQTSPTQTPEPTQTPTPIQEPAPALLPGRATRGGSSYIGVGGNIGLGGNTTLSEGSFSVFSKIGLTNNFSFRPAGLIGDNSVILLPLTLDFPVESVTSTGEQQINVAPYIGAGAAISTGQDSTVGFLLTGGVDVPLSPQFTATAGVNVGFIDETEVGLLLGLGYNF